MAVLQEPRRTARRGGQLLGRGDPAGKMRRDVGLVSLTFASLGSIIGSGWLFGALYAAQAAGPAAILSWTLGGIGVIVLALIHAELGSMYPVAGGSARFPHYSHGSLVGFSIGWIAWIGAVTTAPIEVEAALQYATHYASWLTHQSGGVTVLTPAGYGVAAVLMLLFTVINLMGVRWLAETNKWAVWWKIAIPLVTVIALLATQVNTSNLTAGGGFMPYGFKGVLVAISTGGVIFGYLGFEQAIQLAGESRNPARNIPRAVLVSMAIGIVLYLALQIAFLLALEPSALTHGWKNLAFSGTFGPFAGIASALGLTWLLYLLYTDAIISPGGTGLLYTGTSSRLSFALSRNGYIPAPFGHLNMRGVPVYSIVFSFLVGMIVFLPFPGWQTLVGFVTAATVLAYAMAPLALGALRRQEPDRERPFRLPGGELLAPLGFAIANLIVLWAEWTVVWKLFLAIALGFVLMAISRVTGAAERRPSLDWRPAMWLWPYICGMTVISYLSSFGGRGTLPFGWDMLVTVVFSVAIYVFALSVRLPPERVREYVGDLAAESAEEERQLGAVGD